MWHAHEQFIKLTIAIQHPDHGLYYLLLWFLVDTQELVSQRRD